MATCQPILHWVTNSNYQISKNHRLQRHGAPMYELQHWSQNPMHVRPPTMPLAERAALRLHGPAEEYSGLGITTLYKLAHAGKIEMIKIGGRALVSRASLDRLLENRRVLG